MSPANEPSATGAQRWLIRGASLLGDRKSVV